MTDVVHRLRDKLNIGREAKIVICSGQIDNLVTGIVFKDRSPTHVINYGHLPEYNDKTRHLHESIRTVYNLTEESPIYGTTPEPVELFIHDGLLVSVQSSLPGTPGVEYIRSFRKKKRVKELVRTAFDWASIFHNENKITSPESVPPNGFCHINKRMLDTLRGPMHRDFVTSNILIQDDHCPRVIDWEDFTREGFPIVDLYHLIVECSIGDTLKKRIENALYVENWYTEFLSEMFEMYASELNIEMNEVKKNANLFLVNLEFMTRQRGGLNRMRWLKDYSIQEKQIVF
ncbi:hypothetical protein [Natrarchaeobius chitinivorans]|uniref:hypothetical protein n=1 Tax=Natrarchaeobius chitinivorans TaxID=1679083 RepID=UPI000F5253E6|nr:hypothetical protein [Natrarchaeobius chitinivorans]